MDSSHFLCFWFISSASFCNVFAFSLNTQEKGIVNHKSFDTWSKAWFYCFVYFSLCHSSGVTTCSPSLIYYRNCPIPFHGHFRLAENWISHCLTIWVPFSLKYALFQCFKYLHYQCPKVVYQYLQHYCAHTVLTLYGIFCMMYLMVQIDSLRCIW